MMPLHQIVVLALVQGITEFLPISSSAHLILVPIVFQWDDQGLLVDIATHIGTLVAVLVYFGREVLAMARGLSERGGPGAEAEPGRRLAAQIVLATLPVVVVGFTLRTWIADGARDMALIAWTTIGFGLLLLAADRLGGTSRRLDGIGYRDALLIGCAQVLALVPGVSRSGITMTAARFLGYAREDGARFSLLLAIPTTAAAGALAGWQIVGLGDLRLGVDALLAAVLSCLAALAAIAWLLRWLRRATFMPFVVYRLALGLVLLAIVHF